MGKPNITEATTPTTSRATPTNNGATPTTTTPTHGIEEAFTGVIDGVVEHALTKEVSERIEESGDFSSLSTDLIGMLSLQVIVQT